MFRRPHRRSQRLAAWLGVVAIWLAVLMPLGSQLLANETAPADAPLCSAADHRAAPASGSAHAVHHLDACGYCSLLAHCPALHGAARAEAPPPAAHGGEIAPPVFRCARQIRYLRRPSRAPPSIA